MSSLKCKSSAAPEASSTIATLDLISQFAKLICSARILPLSCAIQVIRQLSHFLTGGSNANVQDAWEALVWQYRALRESLLALSCWATDPELSHAAHVASVDACCMAEDWPELLKALQHTSKHGQVGEKHKGAVQCDVQDASDAICTHDD